MSPDDIRSRLLRALTDVAPEIDPAALDGARALRRQVDLDSADWLNFLVALKEQLGVEIPDADAAHLTTLDQLAAYCTARLAGRPDHPKEQP